MLLGVIGKPILQSKSPLMQNAALRACGIEGSYVRVAAESAEEGLRCAKEAQFSGLNVTAPFKEEMYALLRREGCEISAEAEATRAVNTVMISDASVRGCNTDVAGVQRSFAAADVSVAGARALVLGAGGAARAAVCALRAQGALVTIANRSPGKAEDLAARFACESIALPRVAEVLPHVQIVVNTAQTTAEVLPGELLRAEMVILDALYAQETALQRAACAAGARLISGLEWLLWQGAEAFSLFSGREAPVEAMREALGAIEKSKRHVALVGMMGVGKSTTAEQFARLAGMRRRELDEEIEQRIGCSIAEMVTEQGEEAFREAEYEVLEEALGDAAAVISCGGGVPTRRENRRLLKEAARVVWLWALPKTLSARMPDAQSRPLLRGFDTESRLQELLASRRMMYADVCDLFLPTGMNAPEKVAQRIKYEIDCCK